MAEFGAGPTDEYAITSVDVGIFNANASGPAQPITVNLYTTANFPSGFPGSLTLIGTTSVQVADQAASVLNVPITATVPQGTSQVVLEVAVPDGTSAGNIFFMGANEGSQTGPSYVSAAFCGVNTPTTTAEAGFPTVRWVMNINGSCDAEHTISGRVSYAHNPLKPVPGTALNGNGVPAIFQATDLSGSYSLSGFGEGSYTITPAKPNVVSTASNGIFANDAALIARHIVGLTTLNATQQAAARVSGGTVLTTFDAGLIARWIVGISAGGNQTGQWKFTPVNRTYASIASDLTGQDYSALLMGDVSGDWTPPASRSLAPERSTLLWNTVAVSVPNLKILRRGTITIPVRLDNLMGKAVSSFQFDVEFDPNVISPETVAADLTGTMSDGLSLVSNSPRPGLLKVVVYGVSDVTGEGTYINLLFRSNGRGRTPIIISGFRLNDGTDKISVVNGSITVE